MRVSDAPRRSAKRRPPASSGGHRSDRVPRHRGVRRPASVAGRRAGRRARRDQPAGSPGRPPPPDPRDAGRGASLESTASAVLDPTRLRSDEAGAALRAFAPTAWCWSPTASWSRRICWTSRSGRRSTSTPRCCRGTAARHRWQARSSPATAEGGVTLMVMTAELDAGPIVAQLAGAADRTRDDARARGTPGGSGRRGHPAGARALGIGGDRAGATGRLERRRTSTPSRARDGWIDWRRPAVEIDRQVRALQPWPGAWTTVDGRRIHVRRARAGRRRRRRPDRRAAPGRAAVRRVRRGALALEIVQPEGRAGHAGRRMAPRARPRARARSAPAVRRTSCASRDGRPAPRPRALPGRCSRLRTLQTPSIAPRPRAARRSRISTSGTSPRSTTMPRSTLMLIDRPSARTGRGRASVSTRSTSASRHREARRRGAARCVAAARRADAASIEAAWTARSESRAAGVRTAAAPWSMQPRAACSAPRRVEEERGDGPGDGGDGLQSSAVPTQPAPRGAAGERSAASCGRSARPTCARPVRRSSDVHGARCLHCVLRTHRYGRPRAADRESRAETIEIRR